MFIERKCCTCKEIKPIEQFTKNASKSTGYNYQCKVCKKLADSNRIWKPRILSDEQKRIKYDKRTVVRRAKAAAKRAALGLAPGRNKTDEQILARKRAYRNRYRKENKANLLANRLRVRLKKVLKANLPQNKKSDTRSYFSTNIGCKGQELVLHIESQWTEGMSWDNYGWGEDKWTIDHIRPIADFIKTGEDLRKANHYTNLAPMWYIDNVKKGAKF